MNSVTSSQTQTTAPAKVLDEWVHIPTPGDHYSPRTGSAVITVIREMTRWHAAEGGKSRVLVARGTWDGYDDGAREEVDFPRLGTPGKWQKAIDRTLGAVISRRLLSGRPYVAAADVLGKQFNGVVFVHNEPSGVEAIARLCPNAQVCLWVQNELFRTYTISQVKRVIEHAHRIICCSDYIRKGIVAKVGEHKRLKVVLNGVDPDRFRPWDPLQDNNPPLILFVGRMVPEKGPDMLLRAGHELLRRGISFRLRLVGSSNFNANDNRTPFEAELQELAKGLGDRVEFSPFRPRAEIVSEYQAADILCVPSNWDDPCPLTVIEGMASGLAIVASRRGGIPEVGRDAVLYFDPPNITGLAQQLTFLIENIGCRNELGTLARDRAFQLSWRHQYQKLSSMILSVDHNPNMNVASRCRSTPAC